MDKINIDAKIKKEIIDKYNNGISMRKIEKQYSYSFTYIQKLIKSFEWEEKIKLNYPQKDNHNMVAICIKTKKTFNDYSNESGAITKHIFYLYPDEQKKSKYKRKSIEYKTGKFWYDQYFTFNYIKSIEQKKCKYCDWMTNDIENKSGAYEKHLKLKHNIDLSTYIKEFPSEKEYFKKEIYEDLIECKICNKKFKSITNTHLRLKHNITPLEYKLKYENSIIVSNKTKQKLKNSYDKYLKNQSFIKTSKIEAVVNENIDVEFIHSDRKILNGKEIDLLYNNYGFEINGCLFHTEMFGKKDRLYHLNKTNEALNKGINLYHIFEDEIMYKPNIVFNKIRHILNIKNYNKIIFARKCELFENVENNVKSIFLNQNHIQGNDNKSNINIAAKYNNELVAIMCFDNKRVMNKTKTHNKNTYELTRFAINNDFLITGIASKILKQFIKKYKPETIISFADRRWTPDPNNNLYVNLGFKLSKTLKPEYWYYNPKIDRHRRFHKFGFGKSTLKRKHPEIFNENKTEWEMMQELGYDRIWDCGKFKYELTI